MIFWIAFLIFMAKQLRVSCVEAKMMSFDVLSQDPLQFVFDSVVQIF